MKRWPQIPGPVQLLRYDQYRCSGTVEEQDQPLPAMSMPMLDAAPHRALPSANMNMAESMIGRRPMI
jgi:hypothetical protein